MLPITADFFLFDAVFCMLTEKESLGAVLQDAIFYDGDNKKERFVCIKLQYVETEKHFFSR